MEPQSPVAGFEIMQQFAQGLMQIIQYAQKDMNVQRAAQGQTLAPGSSFGPPPQVQPPPPPTADQPVPQDAPVAKDERWAEHYNVRQRSSDEMAKLRQRNVQEAARRQAAMLAKRDTALLQGPDPFTATPPQPSPENLNIGDSAMIGGDKWTRTSEQSWNMLPPQREQPSPPPMPPETVVRTPQPPTISDQWGNWQNTQVDHGRTTGTDNTEPDATQLGVDLRNQLDRNARVMEHLFKLLTDAIIKINQRLEQVEAGFEPRECT